jgi:hypothetical protein
MKKILTVYLFIISFTVNAQTFTTNVREVVSVDGVATSKKFYFDSEFRFSDTKVQLITISPKTGAKALYSFHVQEKKHLVKNGLDITVYYLIDDSGKDFIISLGFPADGGTNQNVLIQHYANMEPKVKDVEWNFIINYYNKE